jgi:hypothetical protein
MLYDGISSKETQIRKIKLKTKEEKKVLSKKRTERRERNQRVDKKKAQNI